MTGQGEEVRKAAPYAAIGQSDAILSEANVNFYKVRACKQHSVQSFIYEPVAVTSQPMTKLTEDEAGKTGMLMPVPCMALINMELGQVAPPAGVQAIVVQLRPVAAGSLNRVPRAVAPPMLAMVTV